MKVCSVAGCNGPHLARGWCNKHYARWRAHGDPHTVITERRGLRRGQPKGAGHWNWKGDSITLSYRSAHDRVKIAKGDKASNFPCSECDQQAEEWAYDHRDPNEQHDEKGRAFSADPDRYQPLCRTCHRTADWRRTHAA